MKAHREIKNLMIEPKYGAKGTIKPDIFAIWFTPIFIEVQRNVYIKEVMQKKIDLYDVLKKAPTQSGKQLQVLTKKIPHQIFRLDRGHLL